MEVQNLKAVNDRILVEKYDQTSDQTTTDFAEVQTNDNMGVVRLSDVEECPVGQKLYFGKDHEILTIRGYQVYAMKFTNVIAIVED